MVCINIHTINLYAYQIHGIYIACMLIKLIANVSCIKLFSSACLPTCLPVRLPACLPVHPSIHPSIRSSVRPSITLANRLTLRIRHKRRNHRLSDYTYSLGLKILLKKIIIILSFSTPVRWRLNKPAFFQTSSSQTSLSPFFLPGVLHIAISSKSILLNIRQYFVKQFY